MKKQLKNRPIAQSTPVPSRFLPAHHSLSIQQVKEIKQTTAYLHIHTELCHHFTLQQSQQLFILRIATSPKIPSPFKSLPLLSLLTQTVKEMLMNDIEIVIWAIYLDRFAWKEACCSLKIILYITAFAVKSYLSCRLEHFHAFLSHKFPNFSSQFAAWLEKSSRRLSTLPKELNKKYVQLSQRIQNNELGLINYNFTVDSILEMAPPYQHENSANKQQEPESVCFSHIELCKGHGIEEKSDEDEAGILNLPRMDSVFIGCAPGEDQHSAFEPQNISLISKNSWMLESLDLKNTEVEPLPQLLGQQSLFTYYLSQNTN
jgi:hypothetical protein